MSVVTEEYKVMASSEELVATAECGAIDEMLHKLSS
jgi:hypothetical protein